MKCMYMASENLTGLPKKVKAVNGRKGRNDIACSCVTLGKCSKGEVS